MYGNKRKLLVVVLSTHIILHVMAPLNKPHILTHFLTVRNTATIARFMKFL